MVNKTKGNNGNLKTVNVTFKGVPYNLPLTSTVTITAKGLANNYGNGDLANVYNGNTVGAIYSGKGLPKTYTRANVKNVKVPHGAGALGYFIGNGLIAVT